MENKKLRLEVRNRQGVIFNQEIKSLSSKNKKGVFDILPVHANFISLVEQTLIIRKLDGTTEEVEVSQGILRVHQNQVQVLLGVKS